MPGLTLDMPEVMQKTAVMLLTLLMALAGIGLPIWLAIEESERQAFKAESAHALGYARDVVLRANETGQQVQNMGERLAPHAAAPCAQASLDEMREIDLGSTYIQAVGYVQGDSMPCSSILGTARRLDLGPPDYVSADGARIWRAARFPFAPQERFLVLQNGMFAAILHAQLALDTAKSEPDVALAVLPFDFPQPVSARGAVDPAWLARLGKAREAVFVDGEQLVAVVRSDRFRVAGVAALPLHYVQGRSEALAMRLVPAGLAAGVVLSLAILYLARLQMALPYAVRNALRRHELFLEYQPVVDLATGAWMGVEALVRWRRPTGEIVMPDLFIPIAEQNALIVRLTRQVLDRVCRDTGFYLEMHPDFHIGINVAPADFHSPGFVELLQETLGRMGARPSNLILEVTERGLLDPVVARQTSGALRRLGFALAIDDFGTGYSSLSYLESLELDFLKIDRSFIEAIGTGAPTSQVVGHIIRMAKDLGLRMIAEGVESHAQADFLRAQGVQYGQGWLFGRPMSFVEVVRQMEDMARAQPVHATG
ncbi:EAL domain-containing protein [Massilia sp. MS-15]|uniref:EAL domain-containing protein n=1 Tax=Massilia sp. MS-15 TaxID=2878200 RepID=UPI001CD43CBB|nr:EAL domain-containing protein [Massilia sp. MS-15]MCA1246480.1 EAL domain-containing protein [Massilia sp. MS-15]